MPTPSTSITSNKACNYMPNGITWAFGRVVTNVLNLIVQQGVLNQFGGHWLVSDVLFGAISIARKPTFKDIKRVAVVPPLVCGLVNHEFEIE